MHKKFAQIVVWARSHREATVRGFLWTMAGVLVIRFLDWIGRAGDAVVVLHWIWSFVVSMGTFVAVPVALAILAIAHWDKVSKQFRLWFYGPAFKARTIPRGWVGNPFQETGTLVARLAITNTSSQNLTKCSVKLVEACMLMRGKIWRGHGAYPSISPERGEGFLLRWASTENATADRKFLDMPTDGSEHIADVLVLNLHGAHPSADFAAANPSDIGSKLRGFSTGSWWKFTILISSETGNSAKLDFVAALGPDPGPINLDHWHPRGEKILEKQREDIRLESELARQASQLSPGTPDSRTSEAPASHP
jgi:hypothetical protein